MADEDLEVLGVLRLGGITDCKDRVDGDHASKVICELCWITHPSARLYVSTTDG